MFYLTINLIERVFAMNKLIKKYVLFTATAFLAFPVQAKASYLWSAIAQSTAHSYHLVSIDPQGQKAQAFVDKMGQRAISFLADSSLTKAQKEQKFRKLLKNSFDMKTIGRFAMGRYWKTASKTQQAEYQKLFEDMIVKVYSGRFNDYKGEKFDVFSYRADGKRDFLVNAAIVPNTGSKVKVDWRVRNKNGQFKIIDVIIEGVSMSLTQRSDFSSVIQRGGGDVEILLDHLRK